jgi:hypothetical protein
MANRTSFLSYTNVSDATFRLWINEIHDSLIAFGWLRTTDTGQIDYATVTRPGAINTYQGYAVYKMNDALQSTCAVFMRLDFGTASTADGPGIKVQVCIGGTNGAGTLTGNVSSQYIGTNSTASTSFFTCRNAGSSSSFRSSMWAGTLSNRGWIFAVERDLNTSGAETSLGINFLTASPTGNSLTMTSQFLELAGGTGPVETKWYAMLTASQSGSTEYGTVGVAPVRCTLGPFRNPMKTILLFARTDYMDQTTNPITIYGVSRTDLMTRPNTLGAMEVNTINADCGVALLWE